MSKDPHEFLLNLFDEAVAAASAERCLPTHLPPPPRGRTVVIGAGKAAAAMALTVESHWPTPLDGLVLTRYGHGTKCRDIEVVEASHPVPDQAGRETALRIVKQVSNLSEDDLVLALISGGGSALLSLPCDGIPFSDKQTVTRALLHAGATISEINCVRKHLSAIKGGNLAVRCAPARVVALMISDVPGDDPSVIASGPTVPDATTLADARDVIERYRIPATNAVLAHLNDAQNETPKPGDPRFARVENRIITSARVALDAAAGCARDAGVDANIWGDDIEGEAREVGREHAARARAHLQSGGTPTVLLSGGETTVTVAGDGRGGRNVEYLLGLTLALDGIPGIYALACDTDGIDGTEDNAGAIATPDTLIRAQALGLDANAYLANNDAYGFFDSLGDLVTTGPTLTNVNDFRAIYLAG
ncbi:MAG: glycerate kinase [Gammaproteobacteria bacterium]|nr:glycerate kinase [Gammaproteobacteria bacterium]